jgi:hypothetical protein
MSAPHGSMTAFNAMRDGYLAHLALADATARAADLRAYCIDSGPGWSPHQLLAAQEGRIHQNDVKVAELAPRVGFMGGTGVSVYQLAVMGQQAERAQLLIMGGAQPPGYEFVGQNLCMVIWGHPDIVQASITNEGDNKWDYRFCFATTSIVEFFGIK